MDTQYYKQRKVIITNKVCVPYLSKFASDRTMTKLSSCSSVVSPNSVIPCTVADSVWSPKEPQLY